MSPTTVERAHDESPGMRRKACSAGCRKVYSSAGVAAESSGPPLAWRRTLRRSASAATRLLRNLESIVAVRSWIRLCCKGFWMHAFIEMPADEAVSHDSRVSVGPEGGYAWCVGLGTV